MKIHKDNTGRTKGKWVQKGRFKQSKTKSLAMKDITEECGENKFFTMNYANIESTVLAACSCFMRVDTIDTTIY